MKIAFFGSSLLSAYWNGAATYYRGMLKALAAFGHEISFYEPDAYDRQANRDIEPPDWAQVEVYAATVDAARCMIARASEADVVIKASGVGIFDDLLLEVWQAARPDALRIFWDVDAPATLAEISGQPDHPLRRSLPKLDMVLTYGGGPPVVSAYRALGAQCCVPVYNALDPETHYAVLPDARFSADLAFLGNRLPDREQRVEEFFALPAKILAEKGFVIGGAGWDDKHFPHNVRKLGHVPTADHNAFNATPLAVLNVARDSMATTGYSPATRVFEAAGAAACIITDAWEGIELFLAPGREILVARDGMDVVEILDGLTPRKAARIGAAAQAKVLDRHCYASRAREVDRLLRGAFVERQAECGR